MKFSLIIGLLISKSLYSQNIVGKYEYKGKDYIYTLELSKDSTFSLSQKYFEVNAMCKGKWHTVSDTIFLKCNEASMEEKLQSGYLWQRENKAILLKSGNIQFKMTLLNPKD